MDKNYIGDTPGYGQCFCSGACEKLGYCPNQAYVPTMVTLSDIIKEDSTKQEEYYVALTGAEHEGYVFLLGIYSTLGKAREMIKQYCEQETFLPDYIRVMRVPKDANFNDFPDDYPTELFLKKHEQMLEAEEY